MMKKEEAACRVFPPTVLEWRANKKKVILGILRDKTMNNKIMFTPNYDKQNYNYL